MSDFAKDLEMFDGAFNPQSGGFRNLEGVPDGDYTWSILTAAMDRTAKSGDVVLRCELRCEETGQVVNHTYFFRSQESCDRLGGDLATLGFDTGTWNAKGGKKFSEELPKAVQKLPGIRFKGTKKSNTDKKDPNKVYHNLFINAKLAEGSAATAPTAPPKEEPIPF